MNEHTRKQLDRMLFWEAVKRLLAEIPAIVLGVYVAYVFSVIQQENYVYSIEASLRAIRAPARHYDLGPK